MAYHRNLSPVFLSSSPGYFCTARRTPNRYPCRGVQ
jgi:hypothetical protein